MYRHPKYMPLLSSVLWFKPQFSSERLMFLWQLSQWSCVQSCGCEEMNVPWEHWPYRCIYSLIESTTSDRSIHTWLHPLMVHAMVDLSSDEFLDDSIPLWVHTLIESCLQIYTLIAGLKDSSCVRQWCPGGRSQVSKDCVLKRNNLALAYSVFLCLLIPMSRVRFLLHTLCYDVLLHMTCSFRDLALTLKPCFFFPYER